MTIQTAQFRMADRLADGQLTEAIRKFRAQGLSFDGIAGRLYAEHGIEVSGNTVAVWARKLGIEPEPEEAAS